MNQRTLMALSIFAVIMTSTRPTAYAQEMAQELWQRDTNEKITYLRLVDDSLLLSGTKLGLECLNSTHGSVMWDAKVDDSVVGWSVGHIRQTQYLLMLQSWSRTYRASRRSGGGRIRARSNSLTVMNLHTGEALWNSNSTDIYSVVGYYPTPDSTKLIIITADSSRTRSIRCLNLFSGETVWLNDSAYRVRGPELSPAPKLDSLNLGQQQPIFDSDSTMITFLTKGFVRKWNWLTGDIVWETKLGKKVLAPISDGYMPMRLNSRGTQLYVPMNKYLLLLDNQTGEIIWKSPKMYGNVYQVENTQAGLLVRGGYYRSGKDGYKDYLILLDPETGEYVWKKQLTKFKTPLTSNFITFGHIAYIYSDRKMYRVSIADGSYKEIAKKIDVRGNMRLFKVDDQIQLISGETVALMNTDATLVFNSTHELPSSSGFWSTLGTIVTVAVLVAAVAQAGSGSNGGGGGFIYVPPVSYGAARYSELSLVGDSSICMVTKLESESQKGPGIIRVRFRDGELMARTLVTDKSPLYTFSESLSILFTVDDKSKITAFRF